MPAISLVIITLNAEAHLQACLSSARDVVDEIVIIDSGSTDQTVAIAESFGAKVIQQPFLGFRNQKQFAVDQANHDHILVMDADESLSPELITSIRQLGEEWQVDACWINRLNHFDGKPIYHGGWYPDRIIRLFDRRKCSYGPATIHESIQILHGVQTGHLEGYLLQDAYRNRTELIAKQKRYSQLAAEELKRKGIRGNWLRLLVKPAFRFLKEFIYQRGFLDGRIGYLIARASAQYVFMREARLLAKGNTDQSPKNDISRIK